MALIQAVTILALSLGVLLAFGHWPPFLADGLVLLWVLPALTSRIDVCCCGQPTALLCAAVRGHCSLRPPCPDFGQDHGSCRHLSFLQGDTRDFTLWGASWAISGPPMWNLSGHLSHHVTCSLYNLLDVSGSRASSALLSWDVPSGDLGFLTLGSAPRDPDGICFPLVLPSECLLRSVLSLPTEKEQPSRQLDAGAWS